MCKNHRLTAWVKRTVELDENLRYLEFEDEEKDEKAILEAVLNLPPKYRLVIYLYYYEDFSMLQIAHVCGTKETTIRSQLFRARKRLKASLKEAFTDESF